MTVLEGLRSSGCLAEGREGVTRMCKCSPEGATSLCGLGLGYLGPGTLSIKAQKETCLVAEWVRIRMPMQGTQVRSLVQEDTISCRATKPMHCNYPGHLPRACHTHKQPAHGNWREEPPCHN